MTTRTSVVWHGTAAEWHQLAAAVNHSCACCENEDGNVTWRCPPHEMLLEDQRSLNGLLFARRIVARLLAEERATPSLGT